VAIVLPAMPVYICAGALYGKLKGIFMCYLTNFIMNILIFLGARKMKVSLAEFANFQINPKLDEWIKEARHMDRVVLLMCMLPVIPNGMIPYISAQTNVSLKDFAKAMSIGCLPGVVFFVCCGDMLLSEHFRITLPIVLSAAVVIIIMMIFRKNIAVWLEPKIRKFLM
ncbi:MAG: VTT domain-containing protein, partial [Lachnospiraceae bacterium]|nr:VTT domain-containing protein [Lachnospiraceae bacterium]